MKKLLVQLPDELHEDLKELAHRRKLPMAELVRQAIEATYEDELDAIVGERELDAHLKDPSGTMNIEEYMERRFGALHR